MSSFSSSCPRDSALFIDTFLSSISSLSSHHLQTLLKTFITTIHQLTYSSKSPSRPLPQTTTNKTFVSLPPATVTSSASTPYLTIYHSKTKLPIIRILSSTSLKKPKYHAASSPSSPSSLSSSSSS
jgi:hypothetical protein